MKLITVCRSSLEAGSSRIKRKLFLISLTRELSNETLKEIIANDLKYKYKSF